MMQQVREETTTGDYNLDNRGHSKARFDSERETRTQMSVQKQHMHVQILRTTDRSEIQKRELAIQKDCHDHFAEQLVPCQYFNKGFVGEHQRNIPENTCFQELERLQVSHEKEFQMYETELICDTKLDGTFQCDLNRSRIEIKHKNHCLKQYEELNRALKCNYQTLVDELKVEKEKNKLLQEELEIARVTYSEDRQKYKIELTDAKQLQGKLELKLINVKEQAEILQFELNQKTIEKNTLQEHCKELQATLACSHQTFADELMVQMETIGLVKEKLEAIKVSYKTESEKYKTELVNTKEQTETLQFKLDQKTIENNTLQEHCKELQAKLECSHQTFADELMVQMETIGLLKEKLEAINGSYKTESEKYKTELVNTKEQTETLQFKLDQKTIENNTLQEHCKELQAKLECGHQTFADELKVEREKISLLKKELEDNRFSFKNDHLKNETELIHIKQQVETLRCKLDEEIQENTLQVHCENLQVTLECTQQTLELCMKKDRTNLLMEELGEGRVSYCEDSQKYEIELKNAKQLTDSLQCELQHKELQQAFLQEDTEKLEWTHDYCQETFATELQLEREKIEGEVSVDMQLMQQESVCDLPALEIQKDKETLNLGNTVSLSRVEFIKEK